MQGSKNATRVAENQGEPIKHAFTFSSDTWEEFQQYYSEAIAKVVQAAMEAGFTTDADGVLVHPELGPTGFVSPSQEVLDAGILEPAGSQVEGRDLYVFAMDDKGNIKHNDVFSKYMAYVTQVLPAVDLPAFLNWKLHGQEVTPPEFFLVMQLGDNAETHNRIHVLIVENITEAQRVAFSAIGAEPNEEAIGVPMKTYADKVIDLNKTIIDGITGDSDSIAMTDEVDVQVKSAKH